MNTRLILAAAMVLCGAAFVLADAPTSMPASMPATTSRPTPPAADKPSPKMTGDKPNAGFVKRHEDYVALAKKGGIDLYFEGDSITDNWHSVGKAVWAKEFAGWNAANFGIGGDQTQHVLWRLDNGELDGVKPKAFVLMIGTNNLGQYKNEQIVAANAAIIKKFHDTNPDAKILLLGIFPRTVSKENRTLNPRIKEINTELAKLDDGKNVKFLDIGDKFIAPDQTITKEMMTDGLHPTAPGYQIWADAIKPTLTDWLGAPKEADLKKQAEDAVKDQMKNNVLPKNNIMPKPNLPGGMLPQ